MACIHISTTLLMYVIASTSLFTRGDKVNISSSTFCNFAKMCHYYNTTIISTKQSFTTERLAATDADICLAYRECNDRTKAITMVKPPPAYALQIPDVCKSFSTCNMFLDEPETLIWNVHANWMCPQTDFCSSNQQSETTGRKPGLLNSCCTSCSCASDCGKHYECCFTSDDKFNVVKTANMGCFSIQTTVAKLSLYMIYTCPNGQQCLKPNESIRPVFSNDKKRIYATSACALCNQAFDISRWNLLAQCDANMVNIYEVPEAILQEDHTCYTALVQPSWYEGTWIKNFLCNEVQTCNELFQNQAVIEACKATRAPYIGYNYEARKVTVYRNMHCAMCNTMSVSYPYVPHISCSFANVNMAFSTRMLDMIIDETLIDAYKRSSASNADVAEAGCKDGHQVIHSKKDECHPMLCPHGMLFNADGRCGYFVLTLHDASFEVHLKLTPIVTVAALLLTDIAAGQTIASWLQNKCPGTFHMVTAVYLSSVEENGVEIVEELLISITQRHDIEILLEILVNNVRRCLTEKWTVTLGLQSFEFEAELAKYSPNKTKDEEATNNINDIHVIDDNPEGLDLIAEEPSSFIPQFVLTKLYFCDQVELSSEDVVVQDNQIRLVDNNITLGDNEYDLQWLNGTDPYRVRVCLQDFLNSDDGRPIVSHWDTTDNNTGANVTQMVSSAAGHLYSDVSHISRCLIALSFIVHLMCRVVRKGAFGQFIQ